MEKVVISELLFAIKKWFQIIIKKWKIIFLFCIVGGILGFGYGYYKKPIYQASTTFVLEEDSNNGLLAQYAGIASVVGLDFGGGGGTGIFQGDNIMELYKSQTMIQRALLSLYSYSVTEPDKKTTLLDKYLALKETRKNLYNKEKLKDLNFTGYKFGSSRLKDSIIINVVSSIKKRNLSVSKLDKKLNIIKVEVSFEDESFAENFDNALVRNVNEFYVQTKTKKAITNLKILQHQTDSIRNALNTAISNVANSLDANPNLNSARQILRVPSQRKQIDAEANKAILTELVKNLELAKISLRKETPLIQVIDAPVLPLEVSYIGLIKAILIGVFVFSFLGVIFVIIRDDLKIIVNKNSILSNQQ